MRWVEREPQNAIPCGEGSFEIEANSAPLAATLAKIGASAYITAQVSMAAAAALGQSPALASLLNRLPKPELVYVTQDPTDSGSGRWRVRFRVFAVPRQE